MSGGFGRVTIPTNLGEFPPVAPSPIKHRWLEKTCRALTVDEIHYIVEQFGKGAFQADMLHEEVISYINNFRNALMPPEE